MKKRSDKKEKYSGRLVLYTAIFFIVLGSASVWIVELLFPEYELWAKVLLPFLIVLGFGGLYWIYLTKKKS